MSNSVQKRVKIFSPWQPLVGIMEHNSIETFPDLWFKAVIRQILARSVFHPLFESNILLGWYVDMGRAL